jgi:spoIIIJ-associated protein
MTATALEHARSILDTMLGYLGYTVTIEEDNGPDGPTLQILTEDADALIGKRGETLEDIQYLVNRILMRHLPDAPRIRVDVEYYRSMREDKLIEHVKHLADRVRATGQSVALNPLNSYYRRIVHNVFASDPDIMTVSHEGNQRFKRMTIKKRTPKA